MQTMMAFPGQVLMGCNLGERPVPYLPDFLEWLADALVSVRNRIRRLLYLRLADDRALFAGCVTAGALRFNVVSFLLAVLTAVVAPLPVRRCLALAAGVRTFHDEPPSAN